MSAMVKLDKLYKGGIMDKPPKEKKCKDCKQIKPLKDFKKSYKNKDGRNSRCRLCDKKRLEAQRIAVVNSEYFVHDKYYSF